MNNLKFLILALNIFFGAINSMAPKILQNTMPSAVWEIYSKNESIKKGDQSFINDCNKLSQENKKIPNAKGNIVRIATYNVHFWTDAQKNKNYDGILKIILMINADILILQEVLLFDQKRIEEDFQKMGYYVRKFCATQGRKFGNMILSRLPLTSKPIAKTFEIDKKSGGEQRCFINFKVQLPNKEVVSVYGTHLDVYNGESHRLAEINELLKFTQLDKCKNIIIAGDFNSVRKKDYQYNVNGKLTWDLYCKTMEQLKKEKISTETLDTIEKNGYQDCFSLANISMPKFTCWTGTVIDFMFLSKYWTLPIKGCYTFYDCASDHLPIIMDVELKIKAKL